MRGEEDEFRTAVYLNRVAANRFGLSHFVSGYENNDVYAIVIDLADDGHPELIVPEEYADTLDDCANEFRHFEASDAETRAVYFKIVGSFDSFNVTFGASDDEIAGLALFDRIQVITFRESASPDPLHQHLRWRIAKLRDARDRVSIACRERVDGTIDHLEWLIRR